MDMELTDLRNSSSFLFSQAIEKGVSQMRDLLKLLISLAVKIAFIALIYAIVMGLTTYS